MAISSDDTSSDARGDRFGATVAEHWRLFARLADGVVFVVPALIPVAPAGATTSPVIVAAGDIDVRT
jgi:hypothetical protein